MCHADCAARLQRPDRSDHPDRRFADQAHVERQALSGHHPDQPGRAGRQWARPERVPDRPAQGRGLGGGQGRGGGLRLDRVRPARRRLQRPGAHLRAVLLQRRPGELQPGEQADPELLAEPQCPVRPPVCHAQRRAVRAAGQHDHGRLGPGHGQHPGRAGPEPDHLLRVLLRHLSGPGLLDAVPVACPAADHGQQRGPAERLVPGQPEPGHRVQPEHQHLVRLAGQVSQVIPSGPVRAGGEEALLRGREPAGQAPHPGRGRAGRVG